MHRGQQCWTIAFYRRTQDLWSRCGNVPLNAGRITSVQPSVDIDVAMMVAGFWTLLGWVESLKHFPTDKAEHFASPDSSPACSVMSSDEQFVC